MLSEYLDKAGIKMVVFKQYQFPGRVLLASGYFHKPHLGKNQ